MANYNILHSEEPEVGESGQCPVSLGMVWSAVNMDEEANWNPAPLF